MSNVLKKIRDNWLLLFIAIQPIIDVMAYFQTKIYGKSFSWIIRIIILLISCLIIFKNSKNKKNLIVKLSPFAIFFLLHIINLYRVNSLNLLLDLKYFVLVFQMPILTIMLIDYAKANPNSVLLAKKGMFFSFLVIFLVLLLSFVTNSYETTYEYPNMGIVGWFTGSNTPSMILCALCPWAICYSFKKNNIFYLVTCIIAFVLLYFNATKACYATLITCFIVMLFNATVVKNKNMYNKIIKIIVSIIFVFLAVFLYKYSFTAISVKRTQNNIELNQKEMNKINNNEDSEQLVENKDSKQPPSDNKISEQPTENTSSGQQPNGNKNTEQPAEQKEPLSAEEQRIVEILKTSYIYAELIDLHGERKVVKYMKNNLTPEKISNNRFLKVVNAKIETEDSDILTRILGAGYSRFAVNSYDLETDLDAIYYYYGYLGFSIYIAFIMYFIIIAFIKFIKNPVIIRNAEFVTLCYLIPLLVYGGQYSGAFLRKPNANIYLSVFLVLIYVLSKKTDLEKKHEKSIKFLCLHLGYGGIETATINSANLLCSHYNVEIVSFYKLKENQSNLLNNKVSLKYLCKYQPNKDIFFDKVKNKDYFNALKEGIKSLIILIQKKILIIKEIIKNNSDVIVSTRVEFSILLSKYGRNNVTKIAQEHHHHNNNRKYINCLKYKYKNIDYLCALTKSLQKDYKKFLEKTNNYTKIVLLPNMVINSTFDISDLNNKNIISIGRLEEIKRIDELITIFNDLNIKDSKLFIIGSGSREGELKELVNQLNINDKVRFLGYLNSKEQQEYYLQSSVFAMTSITEGLPMVLLEAMQHGLPCIAYETDSGVNDIIKNSQNGYVIKDRNQSDYSKKLKLILSNKKIKKGMQKEALKTIERFAPDSILRIWLKILK